MPMSGTEKRRVRFASIAGLGREDLPLAAEIWYQDIIGQIWSSRSVLKVGLLLTRYISAPDEELLSVGYIERTFNLDVQTALDTLRQMQMFGAIEAFSISDNMVHASLCLTLLQRVKTLETRARIVEMSGAGAIDALLSNKADDHWEPPEMAPAEVDAAEPNAQISPQERRERVMDLVKTLVETDAAKSAEPINGSDVKSDQTAAPTRHRLRVIELAD